MHNPLRDLNSDFIRAASACDFARAAELLDAGASPNTIGRRGMTALLYAVGENYAVLAEKILTRGGNPDHKSDSGDSALHLAADRGSMAMTRLLFSFNASATAEDGDKRTAFLRAVLSRSATDADFIPAYVAAGLSPDLADKDGRSLVMIAEDLNKQDMFDALIRARADVRRKDAQGNSLLLNAARHQRTNMALAAIAGGANVFDRDRFLFSAEDHARSNGDNLLLAALGTRKCEIFASGIHGHVAILEKLRISRK